MICLPALTVSQLSGGRLSWRLPLSEDGLEGLVTGLASDQGERGLEALLADEPALLLWCVCRSPLWSDSGPPDLAAVARWLAAHGPYVLAWGDDEQAAGQLYTAEDLTQWAELAAASAGVADLARQLASPRDAPTAFLFGLLHNAHAWLAACGSAGDRPPTDSENRASADPETPLPAWLLNWLRQFQSQHGRDPIAALIARVLTCWQASPEAPRRADAGDVGEPTKACSVARRARQRWLSSRLGFGNFVPPIFRTLARCRSLEARFDRELETAKLEAIKAFAYGASHEINNPLANISTRAQTLLREERDPERRRKLAVINMQAFRAHELIADLMLFARPPALVLSAVDLVSLADQVVAELKVEAVSQQTVLVRLPVAAPVNVVADPNHLSAALRALCTNALEAVRFGGRVEVSVAGGVTGPTDSDGRAWAEIVVADTGAGIEPEVRRHLFDPYFSGREAGRGLGLGLAKSWRIVVEHGGRIDVDSPPDGGAVFRIRLPVPGPSCAASPNFENPDPVRSPRPQNRRSP